MQAFPEIEILEGEGYGQTQHWLNITINMLFQTER